MEEKALRRILEVSRRLARPIDLSTTLAQVIDIAREVLDADRGTVFLHDDASSELYSLVASGESEIRFPDDKGIAGRCAQSRKCQAGVVGDFDVVRKVGQTHLEDIVGECRVAERNRRFAEFEIPLWPGAPKRLVAVFPMPEEGLQGPLIWVGVRHHYDCSVNLLSGKGRILRLTHWG